MSKHSLAMWIQLIAILRYNEKQLFTTTTIPEAHQLCIHPTCSQINHLEIWVQLYFPDAKHVIVRWHLLQYKVPWDFCGESKSPPSFDRGCYLVSEKWCWQSEICVGHGFTAGWTLHSNLHNFRLIMQRNKNDFSLWDEILVPITSQGDIMWYHFVP